MRARSFVLAVAFLIAPHSRAADENVLPNGDFSKVDKLIGWACGGTPGSVTNWSDDDAASSSSSGSMELSAVFYFDPISMAELPGSAGCASACIPVQQGAAYHLGGQSKIVDPLSTITFTCHAYSDADCQTSFIATLNAPVMATGTSWNTSPAQATGILPATSAAINCTAETGGAVVAEARVDNLFFSTDDIFADGFDVQ